jgi:hypothetical protein
MDEFQRMQYIADQRFALDGPPMTPREFYENMTPVMTAVGQLTYTDDWAYPIGSEERKEALRKLGAKLLALETRFPVGFGQINKKKVIDDYIVTYATGKAKERRNVLNEARASPRAEAVVALQGEVRDTSGKPMRLNQDVARLIGKFAYGKGRRTRRARSMRRKRTVSRKRK